MLRYLPSAGSSPGRELEVRQPRALRGAARRSRATGASTSLGDRLAARDAGHSRVPGPRAELGSARVALADDFQEMLDSLPADWTHLELRPADRRRGPLHRRRHAARRRSTRSPTRRHDWHWRINVAHTFGHAAAAETVRGTLELLDGEGIEGELVAARARSRARRGRPDVGPPRVCAPGVQPPPLAVRLRLARVALLCPDLLFGSKLQGALQRPAMSPSRPATTPSSWS